VTNTIENCFCCFLLSKTLILEPEEAVLKDNCTPCVNSSKRMPYGELGSVDEVKACGCCHSFSSNLSPAQGDSPGGISPGCGCEAAMVGEIVKELKTRMKARGDTGNIIRAEQTLAQVNAIRMEMQQLGYKVDMMINHMGIPQMQQMQQAAPVMAAPMQQQMMK